jgi:hypothetical protein
MKTFLVLGLLMGSSLMCFGADREIQDALDQVVNLEKKFQEVKNLYLQNIQGEGEIDFDLEERYRDASLTSYSVFEKLEKFEGKFTTDQFELFTNLKRTFDNPQNTILLLASNPETRNLIKGCFQGTIQPENNLVASIMGSILGTEVEEADGERFSGYSLDGVDKKAVEDVVTKIKELESQDKSKQDVQEDYKLYMNQMAVSQKIKFMMWLQDQPLADGTKKALLISLQNKGVLYGQISEADHDDFCRIYNELSFIERMKMASWLENPPMADEKDEEAILRRYLHTDSLKEQVEEKELILKECEAYFEAQSLDDQFKILHWMINPPALKETEMEVIAILEPQYEAMKEKALSAEDLFQRWNDHIWQLSSHERMINYKWFKNKQKENYDTQLQDDNLTQDENEGKGWQI